MYGQKKKRRCYRTSLLTSPPVKELCSIGGPLSYFCLFLKFYLLILHIFIFIETHITLQEIELSELSWMSLEEKCF